jgi:uncharacterized protein YcbK (DUF882 family)
VSFWAEGQFIPDALQDINKLLRDHRNNKIAEMDPKLLVLLNEVSDHLRRRAAAHHFGLPLAGIERQAARQQQRRGQAQHAHGRQGDRHPHAGQGPGPAAQGGHVPEGRRRRLLPDSQFVHMDTGRVRYW